MPTRQREPRTDDGSLIAQLLRFRHLIIRHLPFFIVVAQEGNFHRAATRINVTQSALSRRILALEEELGVSLFERSTAGVELTPIGNRFYADAQDVLGHMDRAIERLRAAARGQEGLLRLALNEGAVRCPQVTSSLQKFEREYPNVH